MTDPQPQNEFDLQVPDWLQHVGPVAVSLFCLLVAMSSYSVFEGFDEKEPGTYLSIGLMTTAFLLALAATRNRALDDGTRILAGVLAAVSGLATYDEIFRVHEKVGRWVDHLESLSESRWAHFTDDIIILMGALFGAAILYAGIRRTDRLKELWPFVLSVVIVAVAHGVLDIVSHGTRMLRTLFPDMHRADLQTLEQQLGFYEEYCKIWCEWFVVVFMQRFFHRTKVSLLWPWCLFCAGALAAVALWSFGGETTIPYLILGKPLRMLRNPHALFELSMLWTALAVVLWGVRRRSPESGDLFGLLFVLTPVVLMVARADAAFVGSGIAGLADAIMPSPMWSARIANHSLVAALMLVPGLILGGLGLLALRIPAVGSALERARVQRGAVKAVLLLGATLISAGVLAATAAPLIPNHKFKDYSFEFFELKQQPAEKPPRRGS